jgi:rRNA-processing protein FCF1
MASHRIRGNSNVTLVFLDTNAIFTIFEFSIDLEDELTRLLGSFIIKIPEAIVHEIEAIASKGKGKQKILAKPALSFIKKYPMLSHSCFDNADDALVHLASELDAVIVTNDKDLRERLKEKKVAIVFLRGKQQLVLEK